ncbi:hypothetical protein M9H77_02134 [Catharanthus roseus]|uniref:Uncharacterized protein n=1 Tax=Catharanthus roseus TaxID=4058 RepID=A0ACC0C7U1_CATRO|nr:hypothetical protein M9H77_02134 [Catharanthus roseus]
MRNSKIELECNSTNPLIKTRRHIIEIVKLSSGHDMKTNVGVGVIFQFLCDKDEIFYIKFSIRTVINFLILRRKFLPFLKSSNRSQLEFQCRIEISLHVHLINSTIGQSKVVKAYIGETFAISSFNIGKPLIRDLVDLFVETLANLSEILVNLLEILSFFFIENLADLFVDNLVDFMEILPDLLVETLALGDFGILFHKDLGRPLHGETSGPLEDLDGPLSIDVYLGKEKASISSLLITSRSRGHLLEQTKIPISNVGNFKL